MGFGERLQAHRSKEKATCPVSVLCRVLKVSRSGYYDWKDRPLTAQPGTRPLRAAVGPQAKPLVPGATRACAGIHGCSQTCISKPVSPCAYACELTRICLHWCTTSVLAVRNPTCLEEGVFPEVRQKVPKIRTLGDTVDALPPLRCPHNRHHWKGLSMRSHHD